MFYIRRVRVESPGTHCQHITQIWYSALTSEMLTPLTKDAAVRAIEAGTTFRTHHDTSRDQAVVVIRQTASGRKYLSTIADGRESNNLLELPHS